MRVNKAKTDSAKKQRQLAAPPSRVSTRMREASRADRPRLPEGQRTPPKSDCPPLRRVRAVNSTDAALREINCWLPSSPRFGPKRGSAQAKQSSGYAMKLAKLKYALIPQCEPSPVCLSTGSSGDRAWE
jgi:hypothetical protein